MWKTVKRLLFPGASADGAEHPSAGRWGEEQAERALRKKGYAILGRRLRIGARDELDLVARDGAVLVFVEVKTRKSEAFGRPAASVNRAKRHYLSRAAVRYLKRLRPAPRAFRFDVVEVIGTKGVSAPLVRHIENAFPLDSCYRVP
ncbi:MAG: YraN family protein [Lentisphaerae bacterium]|nr:YraN family protein [Lentisphaerota bacterium]